MAIVDDLRAVAERAKSELYAVHDYLEHSKSVWEFFQTAVNGGHESVVVNRATGSRVDQADLVRLAPRYRQRYLLTFTFRESVSVFEAFLFDFLHRLLLHNPWQFAERQLTFAAVLQAASRDEIISAVIGKQLNELKYEPVREWFAALNRTVRLDCPTGDEIDQFAEVKATRDLLEHNQGVANEVYRRKAGARARHQPGERVEIDDDYHLASWRLLLKVVADVGDATAARLAVS